MEVLVAGEWAIDLLTSYGRPRVNALLRRIPFLLGLIGILSVARPVVSQHPPLDFDARIAPLLASHCLECHQGGGAKGGLDLSRRERALAGGDSGSVITPGKPEASLLWERVANDEMPPKRPLTDEEKQTLRAWLEAGAPWGSDPIDPFRYTTDRRAGYDWWSFRPIALVEPPAVRQADWPINAIDRFVLARLESAGLCPSPPADRRTLIRRVTYDLIGLPPTPEEVRAFVEDSDPEAYEKLVDRLLASPQYGERWARHWLDLVRYGETDGFERNGPRPHAWHYRQWLIEALNDDMPYDRFCRRQLAGDVLEPDNPDAIRATGFLVAGVHNTVLGNDMMRAIARQDELEDIIGNVSQTFLGLTANCGRCHDHKFDPITQRDYYRLASSLSGVQHGERELRRPEVARKIDALSEQITVVERQLFDIEGPARRAAIAARHAGSTTNNTLPEPLAAWDFTQGLEDRVGSMHCAAVGDVKLDAAGARVREGAYLRSRPLPRSLTAKTLEAWVRLDDLNQRGGGVLSLETPNGDIFDAIVYGEREAGRWMAGSNHFARTQSFHGPAEENAASEPVHVAIVYEPDGTIRGYRNGIPYGEPYASRGPQTFEAQNAVVLIGCRHEPPGGNRMLNGTIVAARLYDRALSPAEVAASAAAGGSFASETEILAQLTPEHQHRRMELRKQLAELRASRDRLENEARIRMYVNVPKQPAATRLLLRGDVTLPSDVMSPGGIAAVLPSEADFHLPPDAPEGQRRAALAAWITHPDNPLFPRVIVNRLWHYHFGSGLVETPSDFGFNGGRPSHPELLDWLAAQLVAHHYHWKPLHRLIVQSATYRQSARPRADAFRIDADSRLLWRKKPLRVEGEVLRDSMLAVCGLLRSEMGGAGFSDYRIIDAKNGTTYYEPYDPVGPEFHRRSIYRFIPRGANQGLLDLFDCPDPAASAPRRNATTTPLQALALWNGSFALRMAEALAQRAERDEPSDRARRIRRVYELALQREPTTTEAEGADKLVEAFGLPALCRVLFNSNEFLIID